MLRVELNGTYSFEFVPLNIAQAEPDFHGQNAMFVGVASNPLPEESEESPLNVRRKEAPKYSPRVAFGAIGSEDTVNVPEDVNVWMVFPPLVVTVQPVAVRVPVT